MTDLQLAPTDEVVPIKVHQRHMQVMRVMNRMATGMSQVEACALEGIKVRTFQRWIAKPEMQTIVQQTAAEALKAIGLIAVQGLRDAVEFQVEVAAGRKGDPRDANKSAVFLRDLARELAQVGAPARGGQGVVAGDDLDESTTVTVKFNPRFQSQKVSVTTEPNGGPVVEGSFSEN